MKTTLKFLAAAVVLSLSSCVVHRTVVVEQAPAQTYTQAPPPVSEPVPQQQPAPQNVYQQPPPQQVYQQPAPQQQAAPAGYDQFYNQLSPYGQWVNYPAYGYVWVPNEGPGFQPYSTAGHWIYSDYGWTWASDYSWGWAPFHYGRWQYDGYYGWFWIPGNEWAPAWVCWRNYNGYYGWAPLGYGDYTGINYNSPYYTNSNIWVFVPQRHMCERNVYNYYEPRERYNDYIRGSSPISTASSAGSNPNMRSNAGSSNNYYSGPPRSEVESATGAPIRQVTVGSSSNPGQGREENGNYNIYHPQVVQNNNSNNNSNEHAVPVKPSNVVDIHSLPPVTQRPKTNAPPQPYNNSNEQPKEEMKPVNNNAPQPKQTQPQEVRPVNNTVEQPKQQAPPQENKPVNNNVEQPKQTQPQEVRPVNNTVQQQPKQAPPQQQPKNNQPKNNSVNKPAKTQPKQQQSKSAPPTRKDN